MQGCTWHKVKFTESLKEYFQSSMKMTNMEQVTLLPYQIPVLEPQERYLAQAAC